MTQCTYMLLSTKSCQRSLDTKIFLHYSPLCCNNKTPIQYHLRHRKMNFFELSQIFIIHLVSLCNFFMLINNPFSFLRDCTYTDTLILFILKPYQLILLEFIHFTGMNLHAEFLCPVVTPLFCFNSQKCLYSFVDIWEIYLLRSEIGNK